MHLTPDQSRAIEAIQTFLNDRTMHIFILKGYAGTGKTTLIPEICRSAAGMNIPFQLMAPTGRAAKILRSKMVGSEASTIHKGIYVFDRIVEEEQQGKIKYIFPINAKCGKRLIIIDEASMVSSRPDNNTLYNFGTGILLDDLLTYAGLPDSGSKIIFIGDPMQLPPVGDNRSAALDIDFFSQKNLKTKEFELTEVIRQKENSTILTNAMMLRNLLDSTERNELVFRRDSEVSEVNADEATRRIATDKLNSAIVCYSNRQAAEFNNAVRALLFPGQKDITPGDRLMVVRNNYYMGTELFNGDIIEVIDVSHKTTNQSAKVIVSEAGERKEVIIKLEFRDITIRTENGEVQQRKIIETLLQNNHPSLSIDQNRALYVNFVMRMEDLGITRKAMEFKEMMRKDPYFNALNVKYGYAFTCHKAQGGEWDNVYVDFSGRGGLDNDSLRWKYTAVTRAKKHLSCMNLIDVTPMSKLTFRQINKTSKPQPNSRAYKAVADTPYPNTNKMTGLKAKYWSILDNIEGTQYSLQNIESLQYRERYYFSSPDGTVSADCIYNGAGIFTGYITNPNDLELEKLLKDERNIEYQFTYTPSLKILGDLYSNMLSFCDELDIILTNIEEVPSSYYVAYYLKTDALFACIKFFFNAKGFITYADPSSELGSADVKLSGLIQRLG